MALSDVRTFSSQVGALFSTLCSQYLRKRCFGPLQVALVNIPMIREHCGYRRGLGLVHARNDEALGWTTKARGGPKALPPDAAAFFRARRKLGTEAIKGLHCDVLTSPLGNAPRERSLIFRLLDHLGPRDVLILDRGFPSRRLNPQTHRPRHHVRHSSGLRWRKGHDGSP